VLDLGDHGSTFAGGPVVAAAAHAVLDTICEDGFLATVRERGERLATGLRAIGVEPEGLGLMVGFDVEDAQDRARRLLTEHRLVVHATGPDRIRLLPPLTVSEDEIDEAVRRLGVGLH
jgi:acetylornithine/succinyldiaminopimelate/putrescine aminotransferase